MRFCRFFGIKKDIFGSNLLTKDIRIQEDFSQQDQKCLQSGMFQLLPLKDRSGRSVFVHIDALKGEKELPPKAKSMFYIFMEASKDLENQRKGLVIVSMNTGQRGSTDIARVQAGMKAIRGLYLDSLPLRFDGYHQCHDTSDKKAYSTMVTAMNPLHVRMRSRHHEGSLDEIKLHLMSFGIPCSPGVFPVLGEDEYDLRNHRDWYQRKLEQDKAAVGDRKDTQNDKARPGDVIDAPAPLDIIIGKSAFCQGHAGNVKYYNAIHSAYSEYDTAEHRLEKTAISRRILKTMKLAGARFLKEIPSKGGGSGGFILLGDDEMREKIASAFRDQRKRVLRKEQEAANAPASEHDCIEDRELEQDSSFS